jgi:4-hydroxy-3-polyprenylbenzoate decarboxylase
MFPYDSLREYAQALEARGKLKRIKEMDQDAYEMTAFAYRLRDRMREKAPGFLVERTKIGGRWYDSPVVGNIFNGFGMVAQAFGVQQVDDEQSAMYDTAVQRILSFMDKDFRWKKIEPVTVEKNAAPCKQVVLLGDQADLGLFPWVRNNPADVGTYRMQVKGPRKAGVYFTNQSHGYKFMERAMERGQGRVAASVAIGIDPVSWMMSSTRLADIGEDEFALAGGFRGKPVQLVKSETNDMLVPAQAEFILEGDIVAEMEEEGPYGEMMGYIGKKTFAFTFDIKAITHRRNPWVYNLWPGMAGAYLTLPWEVAHFARLKKIMPGLQRLYTPPDVPSVVIACIDKRLPGEGIEMGMLILGYRMVGFSKKVVIVVDKDVDPTDMSRVMHAMGTRWQPHPASLIVPQTIHIPIDPSCRELFLSSKIVIDATRQQPGEGGPDVYPEDNRTAVLEKAPGAFALVDKKWDTYFED